MFILNPSDVGENKEMNKNLEAAGVASVAIETGGAPPWGYEDHLDDDPDFLTRYWRERRSEDPSAIVRAATQLTWTDVAISVDGVGILAVAEGGRVFAASDWTEPLSAVNSPDQHDVLAVQAAAVGWGLGLNTRNHKNAKRNTKVQERGSGF